MCLCDHNYRIYFGAKTNIPNHVSCYAGNKWDSRLKVHRHIEVSTSETFWEKWDINKLETKKAPHNRISIIRELSLRVPRILKAVTISKRSSTWAYIYIFINDTWNECWLVHVCACTCVFFLFLCQRKSPEELDEKQTNTKYISTKQTNKLYNIK